MKLCDDFIGHRAQNSLQVEELVQGRFSFWLNDMVKLLVFARYCAPACSAQLNISVSY